MPSSSSKSFSAFSPENDHFVEKGSVKVLPSRDPGRLGVQTFNIESLSITEKKILKPKERAGFFNLNQDVKKHLNIDKEEEKLFEERVQREVQLELKTAIEQIKERAYKEGFEKGLGEAKQQIIEEEMPLREEFVGLFQELSNSRKVVYEKNKKFLIELFFRISRYFLLREIDTDPEYLNRLVTHLIDRLENQEHIKIYLSPSDYKRLTEVEETIKLKIGKLQDLSIDEDEAIEPGGCRLETMNGVINANLGDQLENIARSLGISEGDYQEISALDKKSEEVEEVEKEEGES